jgi:hypothetical protein
MQIKPVPWMLLRRGGKKGISNNANGDLRCLMNKEKRLIGNNMSIVHEKKGRVKPHLPYRRPHSNHDILHIGSSESKPFCQSTV